MAKNTTFIDTLFAEREKLKKQAQNIDETLEQMDAMINKFSRNGSTKGNSQLQLFSEQQKAARRTPGTRQRRSTKRHKKVVGTPIHDNVMKVLGGRANGFCAADYATMYRKSGNRITKEQSQRLLSNLQQAGKIKRVGGKRGRVLYGIV